MEDRTFLNYLAFTVPHVTVFAGAIFGILLIIGVSLKLSLAIFSLLYGLMLLALGLVVRPHFSGLAGYRLYMLFSALIVCFGLVLLLFGGSL
jgi:uncharacterized membrane protein YphA (DoxX/SURF4 family)